MILLDTNICIQFINARPAAVMQRFRDYRMGEIGMPGSAFVNMSDGAARCAEKKPSAT